MFVVIKSDNTQFADGQLDRLLELNKDKIIEYQYKGKFIYIVFKIDYLT